jgi:hypothetical protein
MILGMKGKTMRVVLTEFRTAADFWAGMIEPDYQDCLNDPANLRAAFHAAISLFHMHDWVWTTHEARVRAAFMNVHNATSFANALEKQCEDFGRIRGIANAAKHLKLSNIRPVPHAPGHANDTAVSGPVFGGGSYYGKDFYGPCVMLGDMPFSNVICGVYKMWNELRTAHGW